ncbi:DNA sulfur modification protein DndB [Desulfospira joergensenii]|uniref:DNA sulfur modification protein DndB n=1 Tax=Desulfospira joergensenii TaxID=53329 RepID=UPI0003B3E6A0|nr:DNA sulfur modification protein DndB [Desulfospira joergensenii]
MGDPFEYVFPAIRGVQANREYYITMCPMRLIPKIFLFNEEELVPELRAQRTLNKARLPEMSRYIVTNRDNYVFSAITASIDADVKFEPIESDKESQRMGLLHIPMSAQFIINDGQHRRAAIEMALRENSDIADETISVVFFMDKGLKRCQQMFADLNRYAIRPSKSIGVLYDHRDINAEIARSVAFQSKAFVGLVEMEKTTLSPRSRRLFTLSSIYSATVALIKGCRDEEDLEGNQKLALSFWDEVAKLIPEWDLVREQKITAGDIRRDFIHSHSVVLQSVGNIGNTLFLGKVRSWKKCLKGLKTIDWSRTNSALWEGRAMSGGRVTKSHNNVILTTNAIKNHLKIELGPEEQRVEDAFLRGDNGKK